MWSTQIDSFNTKNPQNGVGKWGLTRNTDQTIVIGCWLNNISLVRSISLTSSYMAQLSVFHITGTAARDSYQLATELVAQSKGGHLIQELQMSMQQGSQISVIT